MQFGVLVTDNGKHSGEKLAIACATDIVQIGADATGQQAIDGRKLENRIIEIMEAKFAELAAFEHAGIATRGTEHLTESMEAHPEILNSAVSEIGDAIVRSPFASWFTSDRVDSYVRASVAKWLTAGQHMHRDWFAVHGMVGNGTALISAANHNPECKHVKDWIARGAGLNIGVAV